MVNVPRAGKRTSHRGRLRLTRRIFACFALLSATAVFAQEPTGSYEGPSILSRDTNTTGKRAGLLDYRFWGQITGVYDTALTPVVTNASGGLAQEPGAYGIEAGGGIVGSKLFRHDEVSVDYNGTWRHYPNSSFFDGTDQFLDFAYKHTFTRHLVIETRLTAGVATLSNGAFTYAPISSTEVYSIPVNQLFDNRTEYLQPRVDLTWIKSSRLSFSAGGEGILMRYRSQALASVNGYNAHADAAYRITRRQTVYVSAERTEFDYLRTFGYGTFYVVEGGYGIGLSRRWDLSIEAGAARTNITALRVVNLDPAIAAIVGTPSAVSVFNAKGWTPTYSARLSRNFQHSSASISATQGISPGNGVYLTSKSSIVAGAFSYNGMRRLTFAASAAYRRLDALAQTLGAYSGENAGVGVTYRMTNIVNMMARYDYLRYDTGITGGSFRKDSNRISVGLAFSPGERSLPIW